MYDDKHVPVLWLHVSQQMVHTHTHTPTTAEYNQHSGVGKLLNLTRREDNHYQSQIQCQTFFRFFLFLYIGILNARIIYGFDY